MTTGAIQGQAQGTPGDGEGGGGGTASPAVNLLQHDDLRKGVSIFLTRDDAGPDWKFEGVDRDHIPILRKLLLEGTAIGSGVEIALPADLATPGGTDVWNLELTRGQHHIPEQLGAPFAASQAYVDIVKPGTTDGFRISLATSEAVGAAGNSGYNLDVAYDTTPNPITVITRAGNNFLLQWDVTAYLDLIVAAINMSVFATAALLDGSDGNVVMGHPDPASQFDASFANGVNAGNLPFVPAVQAYRDIVSPDLPAPQAFGDFYQPDSTTLGLRVTLGTSFFGTDVSGTLGNAIRLDFSYSAGLTGSGVSGALAPNEVTVSWLAGDTLQEIVDRAASQTLATITLIPGTDGSTVMGHGRTSAQVFGGQTVLQDGADNYILFHDGSDDPVVRNDGIRLSLATSEPEGTAGNTGYRLDVDYAMGANPVTALSYTAEPNGGGFLLQWGPDRTLNQILAAIDSSSAPATGALLPGSDGTVVIGHYGNANQFNGDFGNGVDAIQSIPAVPRDPLTASIDEPNRYIRLQALETDSRHDIAEVLVAMTYGMPVEVFGRNHVAVLGVAGGLLDGNEFPDAIGDTLDHAFDSGTDHEPLTWSIDEDTKTVRLDYDGTDTFGFIKAEAEAQVAEDVTVTLIEGTLDTETPLPPPIDDPFVLGHPFGGTVFVDTIADRPPVNSLQLGTRVVAEDTGAERIVAELGIAAQPASYTQADYAATNYLGTFQDLTPILENTGAYSSADHSAFQGVSATDPAGGVDGDYYYSSLENRFRQFSGGAYTDYIGNVSNLLAANYAWMARTPGAASNNAHTGSYVDDTEAARIYFEEGDRLPTINVTFIFHNSTTGQIERLVATTESIKAPTTVGEWVFLFAEAADGYGHPYISEINPDLSGSEYHYVREDRPSELGFPLLHAWLTPTRVENGRGVYDDYEAAREYLEGIVYDSRYTYLYADRALMAVRTLTNRVAATGSTLHKAYVTIGADSRMFEELGTYNASTPSTALNFADSGIALDPAEDYGAIQWAGSLPLIPIDLAAINGLTVAAAGDAASGGNRLMAPEVPATQVSGEAFFGINSAGNALIASTNASQALHFTLFRAAIGAGAGAAGVIAARDAALAAQAAAEAAQAAAESAETGAESAETGAGTHQTGAETAQTGAETARTGAETARTGAEAAQTAAEAAETAAETARTGAQTAETGAETAETGAETAQTAAEAAVAGAEAALAASGAALAFNDLWTGDIDITAANQWKAVGTEPVPANATWLLWNGGAPSDGVDDGPGAMWTWINAAQWRALIADTVDTTPGDGTARPFVDWVSTNVGDGTPDFARRDLLIGRTSADIPLITSTNTGEDLYGATLMYITQAVATPGGGGGASSFADLTGMIADSQVPDSFTRDTELAAYALLAGAVFSGAVSGVAPTAAAHLSRKDYVDTADALKASLAGATFTGAVSGITPTSDAHLATKAYVDSVSSGGSGGPTDDIYWGTSADETPQGSELTIAATNGAATITGYSGSMHVLVARLATEADFTRIVRSDDISQTNQLGAFTKFASTVVPTGESAAFNVWVSNQALDQAADVMWTAS